jgi:hypothetical protein
VDPAFRIGVCQYGHPGRRVSPGQAHREKQKCMVPTQKTFLLFQLQNAIHMEKNGLKTFRK